VRILQEGMVFVLRNKFKKERRPLITVESIKVAKAQFGRVGQGRKRLLEEQLLEEDRTLKRIDVRIQKNILKEYIQPKLCRFNASI